MRKALVLALLVTAVLGMVIPAMADAPPGPPPPGQVTQPPPPGLTGHKDPGFPSGNPQPPGQFPPGNPKLKVP